MATSTAVDIAPSTDSWIDPVHSDAPSLHVGLEISSVRIKALKYIPEEGILVASGILPALYAFDTVSMKSLWCVCPRNIFGAVRGLDIHGRVLVCGFDDNALRVFLFPFVTDVDGHERINYRAAPVLSATFSHAHLDYIRCVQFQPQSKGFQPLFGWQPPNFLTASDDQTLRLFSWSGSQDPRPVQKQVLTGHAHYVMCVAWLPPHPSMITSDSSTSHLAVSCSLDTTVKVWNTENGRTLATASKAHTRGINHLAITPIMFASATAQSCAHTGEVGSKLLREWLIVTAADDFCITILRLEVSSDTFGKQHVMIYVQRSISGIHTQNVSAVLMVQRYPQAGAAFSVVVTTASEDATVASLEIAYEDARSTPTVRHLNKKYEATRDMRGWAICEATNGAVAVAHDRGITILQPTPSVTPDATNVIFCEHTTFSLPIGGKVIERDDGADTPLFNGNRVVIEYCSDRETLVRVIAAICLFLFFYAVGDIVATILMLVDASHQRAVTWHEPFTHHPSTYIIFMLSIPCTLIALFDMATKIQVVLTITRNDVNKAETDRNGAAGWYATVGITWNTIAKSIRHKPAGFTRFRMGAKVTFVRDSTTGTVFAHIPVPLTEVAEVNEKLHRFVPKNGAVCSCGGNHPLSEKFVAPMFVRQLGGWCKGVPPSSNEVLFAPGQWTNLAQAIGSNAQASIYLW